MRNNGDDEPCIIGFVRCSGTEKTSAKPVLPVENLTQRVQDGRFSGSGHSGHPIYFAAMIIRGPSIEICEDLNACSWHAANGLAVRRMSGFIGCHFMIEFVDGNYGDFSTVNLMLIGLNISPELRRYGCAILASVTTFDVTTIPVRCPLLSPQYSAECRSFKKHHCIRGVSMNNLRN